jgi:transketolase
MSGMRMESTRVAFLETLTELMEADPKTVVIFADSVKVFRATPEFLQRFKGQVFDVGIAEQNMVATAAGLATCGLTVFAATYAGFITMRACEQVRTFVAYPGLNVKFIGANAGIFGGEREGVTHQFFEDLAIVRSIPGVTVVVPADAAAVRQATRAIAKVAGPAYLRIGSGRDPVVVDPPRPFELGKIRRLEDHGRDFVIFANGYLLQRSLEAAAQLKTQGLRGRVVEVHTLRPLDGEGIAQVLAESPAAVSVEDHQINGALGSAIAEVIAEHGTGRLVRLGLQDVFAESGDAFGLLDRYGLGVRDIVQAVGRVVSKVQVTAGKP